MTVLGLLEARLANSAFIAALTSSKSIRLPTSSWIRCSTRRLVCPHAPWLLAQFRLSRKIGPDLGRPPVNLPGGLHNARFTTLPRPLLRFHDAAILTDTRLSRLCLAPRERDPDSTRWATIRCPRKGKRESH